MASHMAGRPGYVAAGYSPEVKEVLAAVGHQLRQRGWTVAAVKGFFSDAGYEVGDGTLRRWTVESGAGTPIISNAKKAGRIRSLTTRGGASQLDGFYRRTKTLIGAATGPSSRTSSVSA